MRNKVLLAIALLLILISASLFTYPEVSKQVVQGQNDVVISRFDKTAGNVQGDDGGKDDESDNGHDVITATTAVTAPMKKRLRTVRSTTRAI